MHKSLTLVSLGAVVSPSVDSDKASPLDSTFCCCTLIDAALLPHQHFENCELQLLNDASVFLPSSEEMSDTSSGIGLEEAVGAARRRKHRESMARLRHKLRASISSLQIEEKQLESQLRQLIDGSQLPTATQSDPYLHRLQLAYCDLVREQIRLQDERRELERTRASRDRYERLVHREIERARTFHATSDANEA